MIVLAVRMSVADGKQAEAAAAAQRMVEATLKETGCLHYGFSWDVSDPCLLRVTEEWESQAALEEHFATPHMADLQAALPAVLSSPPVIRHFTVVEARTL